MQQITSQIVAQGSYGLRKINQRNGTDIGHVIKVWHAHRDHCRVGTFLTRREARECIARLNNEYGK